MLPWPSLIHLLVSLGFWLETPSITGSSPRGILQSCGGFRPGQPRSVEGSGDEKSVRHLISHNKLMAGIPGTTVDMSK